MPRLCSVCTHPDRTAIDEALLLRADSNRRVASQYGLTERAIRAHLANHLTAQLREVAATNAEADVRQAIDVIAQLRTINEAAVEVLQRARKDEDGDLALKAIDRVQRQLELQAKLLGDLSDGSTVSVSVSTEWTQIRGVVLGALRQHPAAAQAVAAALVQVEGGLSHGSR
jgi:hypothetical protein